MTTLQLKHPTTKGERTITVLNFADPKVKHLLPMDKYDPESVAATLALASSLTGEPELLLGELHPEDWIQVQTYVMDVYNQFCGIDLETLAAEHLKKQAAKNPQRPATNASSPSAN